MSYYDDASIMFIGGAATGVDGKAGTAKPINGGSPLYVTRGNNLSATRVDSNGLIEKGRENLLKQSNQFDTTWGGSASVTSGQSGYDGSSDAWLLSKSATQYIRITQALSPSVSGIWTFSVYAKEGTASIMNLRDMTNADRVQFDLSGSGSVDAEFGNISSKIESVGNGWFRCSATFNGTSSSVGIYVGWNDSTASNIYIQDAQLEIGLVATEYIESGATTGLAGLLENEPRFNYPIGGSVPHFLLEPSRANIIGYSEYFDDWTNSEETDLSVNNTTSPEGVQNAYSITPQATSNYHRISKSITIVSGNQYSFSFFAKANGNNFVLFRALISGGNKNVCFNISNGTIDFESSAVDNAIIEDYGNGWYRCSVVWTASTGGQTIYLRSQISSQVGTDDGITEFTGNGRGAYFYGVQLEEGSYPTSYIPNHTAGSVSRESESVTTASVPSLINQDEGVFFVDFEFLDGQTAENQNWIALESENNAEKVLIYKSAATNNLRYYLTANGSLYISGSTIQISPNTRYKVAVKYSNGDFALAINGNIEVTDSSTYTRGSDLSRVTFNESNILSSCRMHEAIVFESGWDNVDLEILTGATPYQSFAAMAATLNYTVYE